MKDPARHARLAVGLLLALFVLQAVTSLRQKSVTTDELMYIAAGFYHLETGSFDFNTTNPPLMKVVTAAPLLLLDVRLPPMEGDPAAWSIIEQWRFARAFLYENNVDADRILFAARLPVVLFGVLLGLLVYSWSSRLYGRRAGLFALFLYAFSPNVLAHTRLATQDMGVTFFYFASAYAFWRYTKEARLRLLLIAGLCASGALLAKTSGVFLVPMLVLFGLSLLLRRGTSGLWSWPRAFQGERWERWQLGRLGSLFCTIAVLGLVMLVTLNLGYLGEDSFEPIADTIPIEKIHNRLPGNDGILHDVADVLAKAPVPLPAPFLKLVQFQVRQVSSGNRIYFRGDTSRDGWWYLMLVSFLIKTPVPLLILVAVATLQALRKRPSTAELLILIVLACLFGLFTYLKSVSVGLRYLLPAFPFLHVLASRVVRDMGGMARWKKGVLGLLAGWYLVGAIRIHPHYLAHFNEFVGGPDNGYLWLADSHLDWGQDLPGLKRFMDERGIDRVRFAYFGSGDARHHGIEYDYLPSVGLTPQREGEKWWFERKGQPPPPFDPDPALGPIAISATLLAGVFLPGHYAVLRDREPDAQVGYSILLYNLPKGEDRSGSQTDR